MLSFRGVLKRRRGCGNEFGFLSDVAHSRPLGQSCAHKSCRSARPNGAGEAVKPSKSIGTKGSKESKRQRGRREPEAQQQFPKHCKCRGNASLSFRKTRPYHGPEPYTYQINFDKERFKREKSDTLTRSLCSCEQIPRVFHIDHEIQATNYLHKAYPVNTINNELGWVNKQNMLSKNNHENDATLRMISLNKKFLNTTPLRREIKVIESEKQPNSNGRTALKRISRSLMKNFNSTTDCCEINNLFRPRNKQSPELLKTNEIISRYRNKLQDWNENLSLTDCRNVSLKIPPYKWIDKVSSIGNFISEKLREKKTTFLPQTSKEVPIDDTEDTKIIQFGSNGENFKNKTSCVDIVPVSIKNVAEETFSSRIGYLNDAVKKLRKRLENWKITKKSRFNFSKSELEVNTKNENEDIDNSVLNSCSNISRKNSCIFIVDREKDNFPVTDKIKCLEEPGCFRVRRRENLTNPILCGKSTFSNPNPWFLYNSNIKIKNGISCVDSGKSALPFKNGVVEKLQTLPSEISYSEAQKHFDIERNKKIVEDKRNKLKINAYLKNIAHKRDGFRHLSTKGGFCSNKPKEVDPRKQTFKMTNPVSILNETTCHKAYNKVKLEQKRGIYTYLISKGEQGSDSLINGKGTNSNDLMMSKLFSSIKDVYNEIPQGETEVQDGDRYNGNKENCNVAGKEIELPGVIRNCQDRRNVKITKNTMNMESNDKSASVTVPIDGKSTTNELRDKERPNSKPESKWIDWKPKSNNLNRTCAEVVKRIKRSPVVGERQIRTSEKLKDAGQRNEISYKSQKKVIKQRSDTSGRNTIPCVNVSDIGVGLSSIGSIISPEREEDILREQMLFETINRVDERDRLQWNNSDMKSRSAGVADDGLPTKGDDDSKWCGNYTRCESRKSKKCTNAVEFLRNSREHQKKQRKSGINNDSDLAISSNLPNQRNSGRIIIREMTYPNFEDNYSRDVSSGSKKELNKNNLIKESHDDVNNIAKSNDILKADDTFVDRHDSSKEIIKNHKANTIKQVFSTESITEISQNNNNSNDRENVVNRNTTCEYQNNLRNTKGASDGNDTRNAIATNYENDLAILNESYSKDKSNMPLIESYKLEMQNLNERQDNNKEKSETEVKNKLQNIDSINTIPKENLDTSRVELDQKFQNSHSSHDEIQRGKDYGVNYANFMKNNKGRSISLIGLNSMAFGKRTETEYCRKSRKTLKYEKRMIPKFTEPNEDQPLCDIKIVEHLKTIDSDNSNVHRTKIKTKKRFKYLPTKSINGKNVKVKHSCSGMGSNEGDHVKPVTSIRCGGKGSKSNIAVTQKSGIHTAREVKLFNIHELIKTSLNKNLLEEEKALSKTANKVETKEDIYSNKMNQYCFRENGCNDSSYCATNDCTLEKSCDLEETADANECPVESDKLLSNQGSCMEDENICEPGRRCTAETVRITENRIAECTEPILNPAGKRRIHTWSNCFPPSKYY